MVWCLFSVCFFSELRCPNFSNPCAKNDCKQMCFVTPLTDTLLTGGVKADCMCNSSFKMSPRGECVPETSTCQDETDFRCGSGDCVPITATCDGVRQCLDGSDESLTLCNSARTCPPNFFKCVNRRCIDMDKHCNGIPDCLDGSDEDDCGPIVLRPDERETRQPQTRPLFSCPRGMFRYRNDYCKHYHLNNHWFVARV